MKKRIIVLLMAMLVSISTGCGSHVESESGNRIAESGIENKVGNRASENATVKGLEAKMRQDLLCRSGKDIFMIKSITTMIDEYRR